MQPSYGNVPPDNIYSQQFLPIDDSCSSLFPISNPQPIPLTHELFHHLHRHHFRPPQDHHPLQHPPLCPMKFKLGLNKTAAEIQSIPPQQILPSWHPPEDSTSVKEPFWKQPSKSNIISNKHHCENAEQPFQGNKNKHSKPGKIQKSDSLEKKYRLFGELEDIYSLGKVSATDIQTGSTSALTGEHSPKKSSLLDAQNTVTVDVTKLGFQLDHWSENSNGEEAASLRKSKRRLKKRKLKENLSSMVGFLENLVKQVMDHQEMLHKKFLQVIDRMEKERAEREEKRRRQEAEKYSREALTRAKEQSLASSREAEIVSYLEKITGQTINFSFRKNPLVLKPEPDNRSRWPKAEVEALIQARSSIDTKFKEPGLKGPLWEEISSLMVSMGYQRSAKRCKEKWENINKYFKKAKLSRKMRPDQSKTCSYFSQLDQLYSTSHNSLPRENEVENSVSNSSNPSFRNKKTADDKVEQRSHEDEYDMDSDNDDDYEDLSGGSDEEI